MSCPDLFCLFFSIVPSFVFFYLTQHFKYYSNIACSIASEKMKVVEFLFAGQLPAVSKQLSLIFSDCIMSVF